MRGFFFLFLMIAPLNVQAARLGINEFGGCAILNDGLNCWGGMQGPEKSGLQLVSPTQFAPYVDGGCVLDQGKIKCWEYDKSVTLDLGARKIAEIHGGDHGLYVRSDQGVEYFEPIPSIYKFDADPNKPLFALPAGNITDFSAYGTDVCWIMNDQVGCYARDKSSPPRALQHPKRIWVSEFLTCVQDDLGYLCWQRVDSSVQYPIPANTTGLEKISLGEWYSVCGVRNGQMQCWNSYYGLPSIKNPIELALSGDDGCALLENGVKCWGQKLRYLAWAENTQNPVQLFSSYNKMCVRTANGDVTCVRSGERRDNFMDETGLQQAGTGETFYSMQQSVACGRTKQDGFSCRGFVNQDAPKIPKTYNPSQVAVANSGGYISDYGYATTAVCGVEKGKVSCFYQKPTFVPKDVKNATEIAAGTNAVCVLIKGGTRCWNPLDGKDAWDAPTDLHGARSLTMRDQTACVLIGNTTRCWGPAEDRPFLGWLRNPSRLMFVKDDLCAIDDDGLKCQKDTPVAYFNQRLGKILDAAATSEGMCAIGQNADGSTKLVCKMYNEGETRQEALDKINSSPERAWGALGGSLFNLDQLDLRVRSLAGSLPGFQAWILNGIADFLSKNPSCIHSTTSVNLRPECVSRFQDPHGDAILGSRVLLLNLMAPLIHGSTSQNFVKNVIPNFDRSQAQIASFLASKAIDYAGTAKSDSEIQTALKVAELVVRACNSVLSVDENKQLVPLLRSIALAQASGATSRAQALANVKNAYQQSQVLLNKAGADYRTAFLPQMMNLAVGVLP